MNPSEIASKEFPVVMRGYLREEVQAFLAGISDQIAARDNRIAQLDAEVARLKEQLTAAAKPAAPSVSALDRPALLRVLGEEAANILACADASAERMKAQAGLAAERVLQDVRNVGNSLVDVHQLLGELVSLVQSLTEGTALQTLESSGASGAGAPAAVEPAAEVRTVLGEVLGLDGAGEAQEIQLPDEAPVPGHGPTLS